MGLFNRKKPQVVIPRKAPRAQMYKSRVGDLEKTWYSTNRGFLNSPNVEIRNNLEKTRDLSRLLASIDPYAAKYLEMLSIYVTGDVGMRIDPRNELPNGEMDTEVNDAIKRAWETWCEEASFDGRYTFSELESLGIRTVGRDGEALFRIVRGKSVNKFGFALQPIDPALLDVSYSKRLSPTRSIVMGVEYEGVRPVAYHIWNQYAQEVAGTGILRQRERVDADEIIHIFDDDYGNLARGTSWMHPALKTIARLHEFLDTHLLACQIAASAPLVMTSDGATTPNYSDDVAVSNQLNADGTSSSTGAEQPFIKLDFQQILELPANKKLEALNLQYPQTGFDIAVKTYLQSIASALVISYTTLTSDGSKESYSTVRFNSDVDKTHWKQVQKWYANRFHKQVFKAWLEAATLSGALELPSNDLSEYYKVSFLPRGFRNLDPLKDIKAYNEGIRMGLYTFSDVAAEMGSDWRENIVKVAAELEFAKEHGVVIPEMTTAPVVPATQGPVETVSPLPNEEQ